MLFLVLFSYAPHEVYVPLILERVILEQDLYVIEFFIV